MKHELVRLTFTPQSAGFIHLPGRANRGKWRYYAQSMPQWTHRTL
jgi:hypothetical protein